MDLAEQLVERFLTSNGRAFVCSQFDLHHPHIERWNASLDFVVLEFEPPAIRVIAVEVSEAGGLGSVETKAEAFHSGGYRSFLATHVARLTGNSIAEKDVSFLGFVRTGADVKRAWNIFGGVEHLYFRPLSDTIGDWWDRREKGLLPTRDASSS